MKIKREIPRVVIGGTGSNCGKTTVVCSILQAFVNHDTLVSAFKCGPDYIDPMFHSQVIGAKSRNLDLFLCGEENLKYLLGKGSEGTSLSVIEGVMGIYDGLNFSDDRYSANHISQITNTPEILVVNVKGKSASLIAEISGYLTYYKNNIKGVILNNCSKGMYPIYKESIEETLGIKAYGYLPYDENLSVKSRNLGLVTCSEVDNLISKTQKLGQLAMETIDIKGIYELAKSAPALEYEEITHFTLEEGVNIGVAKDEAFSFYYKDNLELLEEMGAKLFYFSPLRDEHLPKNLHGLILGGGYPELHGSELENNVSLREEIKSLGEKGLPIFAECGGFMYLGSSIEDEEGNEYKMVNLLEGRSYMTKSLVRFGYKTLEVNRDNYLLEKDEAIKCHEFHYSDNSKCGDVFKARNRRGKETLVIDSYKNVIGGYPHFHFYSNEKMAENFLKKALEYKRNK